MKASEYEPYRILGIIININFLHISLMTCSGERTLFDRGDGERVLVKVLSDERTAAFVTTIEEIRNYWLLCKDCDWYKSDETILSEARLSL